MGIVVSSTGSLDLHGQLFYSTWTRLAAPGFPGDTTVYLQRAVNWEPGQQPAFQLTSAAQFAHGANGAWQGEVALLSRRMEVQGSAADSEPTDTTPIACTTSRWALGSNSVPCVNSFLTGFGGHAAGRRVVHKGSMVQSGLPTYKAGDQIRMTLAGGVLAWHINGQRAADVRGVPSGVHFGVGRWEGTVEVRIDRAAVSDAVGCLAMLRPLCALIFREGNALCTVRLGGNGAWAAGDGVTLAASLGAASCVVAELDVSGSGLGADEAAALVSAGTALQTLRLGEWVIPVGELRSSESVSMVVLEVGEAEGAVLGALLKASTSLSTLDLSGSSCAPKAARLIGEGQRESAAPLAELRLANVWYTTDGRMPFEAVLERQAVLMSGACRLSLCEVDCSAQAIEATETAALQRGAMLFAPELKVASATLGDDGRSVRPEEDSIGRALLGAVSPMVELVVQQRDLAS
eukprot:jgi/Chrpa1/9288/Chrysochromulina_OHIO_Genome00014484-RA